MSHYSCSGPVYTIEARRTDNMPPLEVCGVIFDGVWRDVSIARVSGTGVPNNAWLTGAAENGYLSHDTAMALAWWFLASADGCVEARLVEYDFKYSYSAERVAEGEPITRTHKRLAARGAAEENE